MDFRLIQSKSSAWTHIEHTMDQHSYILLLRRIVSFVVEHDKHDARSVPSELSKSSHPLSPTWHSGKEKSTFHQILVRLGQFLHFEWMALYMCPALHALAVSSCKASKLSGVFFNTYVEIESSIWFLYWRMIRTLHTLPGCIVLGDICHTFLHFHSFVDNQPCLANRGRWNWLTEDGTTNSANPKAETYHGARTLVYSRKLCTSARLKQSLSDAQAGVQAVGVVPQV